MDDVLRKNAEQVMRDCMPYFTSGNIPPSGMLMALNLARAYLADHPADDYGPATEEWLVSIGFKRDGSENIRLVREMQAADGDFAGTELGLLDYDGEQWVPEMRDCDGGWCDGIGLSRSCYTRGDVRRLCAALGVSLTAPAAAPNQSS